MAIKAKPESTEISVMEVQRGVIEFLILGDSPFISNAMSAHVRQELLFPSQKKNSAEKASTLKHDPFAEFRRSMYTDLSDTAETRIVMPSTSFKKSLMGAALDLPGVQKTQVGRLTYVNGSNVSIYGIPKIMLAVVRNSDINRTPDVRSRAIIEQWAAKVSITYTKPLIKESAIVNLLAAAGMTQGIGDWRIQKGSGNYGAFSLVGADNNDFQRIVKTGGREAQDAAIFSPESFDSETDELLSWYSAEVKRRGFKAVA
jgi:hypothetical protein